MAKKKNVPQPPKLNAGQRQQVRQTRASTRWETKAAGGSRKDARQAGRSAAQTRRAGFRASVPQPPAPEPAAPDPGTQGTAGGFEYNQPVADQLSQPYADLLAGGAVGALPGAFQGYGQAGQMAGGFMDQSGQTLGDYGQLMDPNLAIQQNLARQIQAIQSGADSGYDPLLDQQLGDQERILKEQMRRQLGGDYANSSAGIEALSKFNQSANLQRGTSRFNQLQGLLGQQQAGMGNLAGQAGQFGQLGMGGQQQQYNQALGFGTAAQNAQMQQLQRTGMTQDLYANIPQTMGQFGQAMTGQAGAAVNAQQPYSQDRMAQLGTQYSPTPTQYMGQMMGQSGDRWIQAGSAMQGGGGGGGGMGGFGAGMGAGGG